MDIFQKLRELLGGGQRAIQQGARQQPIQQPKRVPLQFRQPLPLNASPSGNVDSWDANDPTAQIPPGWDAQTYRNFKVANPSLEVTPEDTAHMMAAGRPRQRLPMATGWRPRSPILGSQDTSRGIYSPGEGPRTSFEDLLRRR